MKDLIFDATPLIYLGKLKVLEQIGIFKTKNIICKSVYDEVVVEGKKRGFEEAGYIEKLINKGLFEVFEIKDLSESIKKNPNLHIGDMETLSLAEKNNLIVVSDDEDARKVAEIEDIECVGSIFILFKLLKYRKFSKKELRDLIDRMIELGWRCSTELYAIILKKLEEYKL